MNFTDYQTKSRATAKYPVIGHLARTDVNVHATITKPTEVG